MSLDGGLVMLGYYWCMIHIAAWYNKPATYKAAFAANSINFSNFGVIMKAFFSGIFISLFVSPAFSGTVTVSGAVTDIWMFSGSYTSYNPNDIGLANIYLDSADLEPACGVEGAPRRIAISTDHPLYNSVVSLALMAKTTGKKVQIWHLETCTLRSSSWDFGLIRFAE